MGRNIIYLAENLITGERIEGCSKELMKVIGCKHYDPYNYARTNSVYKKLWKITSVNKTLKRVENNDQLEELYQEWDDFIKSLK